MKLSREKILFSVQMCVHPSEYCVLKHRLLAKKQLITQVNKTEKFQFKTESLISADSGLEIREKIQ